VRLGVRIRQLVEQCAKVRAPARLLTPQDETR
jgi:hypothetical protein